MKNFIGLKQIKARPMKYGEYKKYRGWGPSETKENAMEEDEGYLVEYLDSNKNHPDHEGYISWSPALVFEEAYKESGELGFSEALFALERGKKVARKGWNDKGMWIELVIDYLLPRFIKPDGSSHLINGLSPWIGMKTADDSFVPWLCSQTDMLAKDWEIVV